jgi:uncharacterized OB-fold protein
MPISKVDVEKRMPPLITPATEFFWESGRDGVLRILRCSSCHYYIHPPSPVCPRCWSREVAPTPVSGKGTILSYTVNHQQWVPDLEPFIIAIVQLEEQDDLRLTTNIVDCDIDAVRIGQHVAVSFIEFDTYFLPVFTIVAGANS